MKKILIFALTLVILLPLAGCGDTNPQIDYAEIIADSCGHKSKNNGNLRSYDLVLRIMYSSKAISWDSFEYNQLKYKEFASMDENYKNVTVPLKSEYKYAMAHIDGEETNKDLIFAYDPSKQVVVGVFEQYEDCYLEAWWVIESSYCYYYCHCKE